MAQENTSSASADELDDETYLRKLVAYRNSGINYFASYINVEVTEITVGGAVGHIDVEQHHFNPIGSIHGGCLFALADTVGGAAACSHRRPCTTMNSTMNYLNAAIGMKRLTAVATEIKSGRKTSVIRIDLFDDTDRLLATVTNTYYYLPGKLELPDTD